MSRRKYDPTKSMAFKLFGKVYSELTPEENHEYHRVRGLEWKRANPDKCHAIHNAWVDKNRDRRNAWSRNYMKTYYQNNRAKFKARSRKYKEKMFSLFMDHYGHACTCCGEADRRFLSVEHLEGGGAAHRKRINRESAESVIKDIRDSGWPLNYTTLCFNCNFAKWRMGGTCPHVIDKARIVLEEIQTIQEEIDATPSLC